MELLAAFAFGLVAGVVIGCIPDMLKHYSYRKQLEILGEENYVRVEEPEDPDDVKEREKEEEKNYGFW